MADHPGAGFARHLLRVLLRHGLYFCGGIFSQGCPFERAGAFQRHDPWHRLPCGEHDLSGAGAAGLSAHGRHHGFHHLFILPLVIALCSAAALALFFHPPKSRAESGIGVRRSFSFQRPAATRPANRTRFSSGPAESSLARSRSTVAAQIPVRARVDAGESIVACCVLRVRRRSNPSPMDGLRSTLSWAAVQIPFPTPAILPAAIPEFTRQGLQTDHRVDEYGRIRWTIHRRGLPEG